MRRAPSPGCDLRRGTLTQHPHNACGCVHALVQASVAVGVVTGGLVRRGCATVRMWLQVRTSYGSFLPRYLDPTLAAVQERLSRWIGLPVSFQEYLQVRPPAVASRDECGARCAEGASRTCTLDQEALSGNR